MSKDNISTAESVDDKLVTNPKPFDTILEESVKQKDKFITTFDVLTSQRKQQTLEGNTKLNLNDSDIVVMAPVVGEMSKIQDKLDLQMGLLEKGLDDTRKDVSQQKEDINKLHAYFDRKQKDSFSLPANNPLMDNKHDTNDLN